jgi:hypothetical protein
VRTVIVRLTLAMTGAAVGSFEWECSSVRPAGAEAHSRLNMKSKYEKEVYNGTDGAVHTNTQACEDCTTDQTRARISHGETVHFSPGKSVLKCPNTGTRCSIGITGK